MEDLKVFQKKIGIQFKDESILRMAFTHRSYINENRDAAQEHNERLEFLGDAVLELITTNFLFEKYPDKPEGDLTSYRSALVNTMTISKVATDLGMNDYLLLSKGERQDTGRARQYILANTFEAVIGAIYLDQGYDAAKMFVTTHLLPLTEALIEKGLWQDAKSRLQEIAQEKLSITPHYEIVQEEGRDHEKIFTVAVFFGDKKIAEGTGHSKQRAEKIAARHALHTQGW